MSSNTGSDTQNAINNYINNIEQQYAAAQKYISEMENDINNLAKDQAWLEDELHRQSVYERGHDGKSRDGIQDAIAAANKAIVGQEADIAKCEAALQALDPGFQSINDTINSLMSAMATLGSQNIGSRLSGDMDKLVSYLDSIFAAMRDKLKADEYQAIIENDKGGDLSNQQLEQYAAEMIQYQGSEQDLLSQLVETMANDVVSFHQLYDNGNAEAHKYTACDKAMNVHDHNEVHKAHWDMHSATAMISAITTALNALAPEIASVSPAFSQLNMLVEEIVRKIMKIIDSTNLSPKEKQAQILALMMFLLGFFNLVQQEVASQKAKNEKMMAEANLDSSKMNLADTQMNQKIQQYEVKKAKMLKLVMFIAEIILGAIMTVLAPGAGSALVAAALTILAATGGPNGPSVMDKLTTAIAKSVGNTAAQVIVALLEVVVSLGGGAAADKIASTLAQSAAATAVKSAMLSVKDAISTAVKEAVEVAGKEATDEGATTAAETTLTNVSSKAAKLAAETAYKEFTTQTVAKQLQMIVKGTYKELLEKAMTSAATQAAETAVQWSGALARQAAETGIAATEEGTAAIAEKAAVDAVATVFKKTAEDVAKDMTSFDTSSWSAVKSNAGSRLLMTSLYAAASNDLLLDLVMAIVKKAGAKDESTTYEALKITMEIIQSLLAMYAQSSSGAASQFFGDSATGIGKVGTGLQLSAVGAKSFADIDMYWVYQGQAEAQAGIQIASNLETLLNSYMNQMSKDANLDRDKFISLQKETMASTAAMASHLHDGDNTGAQVLASQAV